MSAIAADRPGRGRNGRESRIKLYSPNHPDCWSPTVTDAVPSVTI